MNASIMRCLMVPLPLSALPFVQCSVASFWAQVDDQEEMEGQFDLQAWVKKVEELLPFFLRSLHWLLTVPRKILGNYLMTMLLRSWSGARRTKGKSRRSWRNSQCLWYAVNYNYAFAPTGTPRLSYAFIFPSGSQGNYYFGYDFVRCRCW